MFLECIQRLKAVKQGGNPIQGLGQGFRNGIVCGKALTELCSSLQAKLSIMAYRNSQQTTIEEAEDYEDADYEDDDEYVEDEDEEDVDESDEDDEEFDGQIEDSKQFETLRI